MFGFDFMFSIFPIMFFVVFTLVISVFITTFVRTFKSSRHVHHAANQVFSAAMDQVQQEEENRPKSLSGMDSILVPQITADFPHFSERQMKDEAAEFAAQSLRNLGMDVTCVHNVVFSSYDRLDPMRTITMQLAIELDSTNNKQRRYELQCTSKSLLYPEEGIHAVNCPNCAAPLSNIHTPCPYCGTTAKVPFEMLWQFSNLRAK